MNPPPESIFVTVSKHLRLIFLIQICLFLVEDVCVPEAAEKAGKTKQVSTTTVGKALKAQSCFHIEYELPGETETVNVDLIVFGLVAKLYREDKFKVTRTWCMYLCVLQFKTNNKQFLNTLVHHQSSSHICRITITVLGLLLSL